MHLIDKDGLVNRNLVRIRLCSAFIFDEKAHNKRNLFLIDDEFDGLARRKVSAFDIRERWMAAFVEFNLFKIKVSLKTSDPSAARTEVFQDHVNAKFSEESCPARDCDVWSGALFKHFVILPQRANRNYNRYDTNDQRDNNTNQLNLIRGNQGKERLTYRTHGMTRPFWILVFGTIARGGGEDALPSIGSRASQASTE